MKAFNFYVSEIQKALTASLQDCNHGEQKLLFKKLCASRPHQPKGINVQLFMFYSTSVFSLFCLSVPISSLRPRP